jgi:uncharacterized protein HemX
VSGSLLAAIGAVVVAIVSGGFAVVSSTKANRPAESNAQLAWVRQAQEEANEARREAKEAKVESSAARSESEQTRQQLATLRRELNAMQDWVDRVLRARDSYLNDHPNLDDSGVMRLTQAINGGPHPEPR